MLSEAPYSVVRWAKNFRSTKNTVSKSAVQVLIGWSSSQSLGVLTADVLVLVCVIGKLHSR